MDTTVSHVLLNRGGFDVAIASVHLQGLIADLEGSVNHLSREREKEARQTSKHVSVAKSLAMAQSVTVSRAFWSKERAALRTSRRLATSLVNISANWNWRCWKDRERRSIRWKDELYLELIERFAELFADFEIFAGLLKTGLCSTERTAGWNERQRIEQSRSPGETLPMLIRPPLRPRMAISKPWPSCPMRFATGTWQSSMITWRVGWEFHPIWMEGSQSVWSTVAFTDFLFFLPEGQARRLFFHENARNSPRCLITSSTHDQINIALASTTDKCLRAVENECLSSPFGPSG